jgi:CHAT domain-containing protein/tetratricopeptide (TPR) repeat protein
MGWPSAVLKSILVAALLPYSATSQPAPLVLRDRAGPVQRSVEGAQPDVVLLPLLAGQYARVEVMQTGSDVVLTLFDPHNERLGRIDSPNGAYGPEPLSLVAAVSGDYRIEVTLDNPKQGQGVYRIALLDKRDPLPADLELVSAERETMEARALQQKRTAESRQQALPKYKLALDIFRRTGHIYQQALITLSIGFMLGESGDIPSALEYSHQAAQLFEQLGDQHMLARALNNTGGMEDLLGHPRNAFDAYGRALEIDRQVGDTGNEATVLGNIGKLHYDTGDWQQALDNYRQALDIYHRLGNVPRESYTLQNMGVAYQALGQLDQALELLQQALPLHRSTNDRRGEADTLRSLGNVYDALNQPAAAVENYELSLASRRLLGDRRGEADTLVALGLSQSRLAQTDIAAATLGKALELAQSTGERRIEAAAMRNLAENSLRAGKAAEAEDWATRSVAVYRELESRSGTELALEQLARAQSALGRLDPARRNMEQALQLIELTRTRADSEQLRASFFASHQEAYTFYIGLLMRAYTTHADPALLAQAFETSERARARSLIEMLAASGTDLRRDADAALLSRQHDVTQMLNAKGARLLTTGNSTGPAAATLKQEIRGLELESADLEAAIRKSSPRYASLVQPTTLTFEQMRREVLDPDTVFLEFSLAEPHSFLWIADRNGLSYRELPSRAVIETAARETMQLLVARQDVPLAAATRHLSELLFGTAAPAWLGKRLVVAPDGALQTVPFAMLPMPGDATNQPLIARYEVVTLPSLSALAALRQEFQGRAPAPKNVAVFADPVFEASPSGNAGESRILEHLAETPGMAEGSVLRLRIPRLPYTRREADEILRAAGHPQSSWRAVGVNASREAALSGQLSHYRFVHFATHGYLDTERPSLSALVLSQVDALNHPVDGFLRVDDIYNLRLNADLVVLSACQTGLGKEVRGEGAMGLTRAFMYAGAPRVIVSLWNVNDRATAGLMGSLYRKMLRQGMRPAEA